MEDDAADDLDPVGPQAQDPVGGLPAGGEGLGEEVVQGLAVAVARLELRGLGLELGVGEVPILLLQGLHLFDQGLHALELLGHVGAE